MTSQKIREEYTADDAIREINVQLAVRERHGNAKDALEEMLIAERILRRQLELRVASLEAENAELRDMLQTLLAAGYCWEIDRGPEIAEEISAQFDIGLEYANQIRKLLVPSQPKQENPHE